MGFKLNPTQQMGLNDRLYNLTERERKFLDKSWAVPFATYIFPEINEDAFKVLYCEDNGRPPTPVNVVIGALLLKEVTQVTDEDLLESIILDIRYQYALHITSEAEIPFSDRTVSRFRERLYKHEMDTGEDLLKTEIERLSGVIAKALGIRGNLKRTDSLMVASSCKRMGRLELMYTCVSNLAKALVESGEGGILPEHLLRYAEETNINSICYRLEKDEVQTRLEQVTADAIELYETSSSALGMYGEFQLLERMLTDQTENGGLKPNKQVSPQSLQNPSDEDATFRRKGGVGYQGYTANIVEDCGENGNIITQYDFDVNLHSDIDFGAEIIESIGPQEEKTTLIADGAYASDKNFESAAENNIELVATSLTGKTPPEIITEFQIEEDTVRACPAGETPTSCSYNEKTETYHASFEKEVCESCPNKDECPVKIRKKHAAVKITRKSINRAVYIKKLSTEEYKKHARKRNGVEGVPSILRRRYRVDEMPIRGLVRSKMWFSFKIGAINIKRFIASMTNGFIETSATVFA